MAKSYYDVLGVPKTASDDDIKAAYRKLAKQFHPDLNPGNADAANKFKEIGEAYETLSDSSKKASYDNQGSSSSSGGSRSSGGAGAGSAFFEDIVNMFQGGEPGSSGGGDITQNVTLTFDEAAFGVTKEIYVNRLEQCPACNGTGAKGGTAYVNCSQCGGTGKIRFTQDTAFGRVVNMRTCSACGGTGKKIHELCPNCMGKGMIRRNKPLRVPFPAGVESGQIMTHTGEGERSRAGGRNGNLVMMVNVLPHKLFKRKGSDLFLDVPITFTQAMLGDKINIPTLKGPIAFVIPEGTQSGTTFRIKGQGIKQLRKEVYGDLFVAIEIELPKTLKNDQKDLIKTLHKLIPLTQYEKTKDFNQNM